MSTNEKRVAVVDDEDDLREAVVEYLEMNGFAVTGFARAADFRQAVTIETFDLAILDIAMPGEDGLSLARWIRGKGLRIGIIFATAAGTSIDRIVGLEMGGDDYVVKPYELREMLARVRSVLRRLPELTSEVASRDQPPAQPVTSSAKRVRFGGFTLDLNQRTLFDGAGKAVDLTVTELELLASLATRAGRPLSRAQILEFSGGADGSDGERAVDIRITRLRKKIEPNPEAPRFIKTVRGIGYVFLGDG